MPVFWRILLITSIIFGLAEQSFCQETRSISSTTESGDRKAINALEHTSRKTTLIDSKQAGGNEPDEMKRIALVIGNSSYRRIQALKNPRNDADDVCKKLQTLKFEVQCQLDISTRNEFRQAIRTFGSRITPRSTVFIYYAGHGVQINGENYLLPISMDANSAADIEDEGLSLSFVLRMLDEARSSPNIVVLDACRNNPFPNKIAGASSKGLARVDPPNGSILVYATSPNGAALDGDGRNGLFTKHLLENLSKPGQKLDELFQMVSKGVEDEARKRYQFEQTPYRSSSYSGAYCLAGCDNPQVALQIEQYKKQGEEAAQKAQALSDENIRLRKKFEERDSYVQNLEEKIARLNSDASNTGTQSDQIRNELNKLKGELEIARLQQRDTDKFRSEANAKELEIEKLQAQIRESEERSVRLEEYRVQLEALKKESADKDAVAKQISAIHKQSEDAARRVQLLSEENTKLRQAAESGQSNVAELEAKIAKLAKEAVLVTKESGNKQEELARLRNALDAVRKDQQAIEKQRLEAEKRDKEIADLRLQVSSFEEKAKQLEEYRIQVQTLQKENAEKTNLLSKKSLQDSGPKPIIVPSF